MGDFVIEDFLDQQLDEGFQMPNLVEGSDEQKVDGSYGDQPKLEENVDNGGQLEQD